MREKARNRTEEKRWEKPPAVSSAVRSCLEEDCRQEILRRAAR